VVVKLAAVLLVPTVVALAAGVLRIVDQAGAAPAYARIAQIARVQQQLSDLIGALAHERDLATAFVARGRLGDKRELEAQLRAVDNGVRVVAGATGQVPGLDFARSPIAALGALGPLRASVTTGFGPVEVVVTEYSDAIDPLIELDSALTRQLDDVAVRLTTEQDAVREALAPAERANAVAGVGPDAELSRQRLLQLILNRGGLGEPLNTSPQDWDQRNAVVVTNISTVEKELRQRIERTAQALLDHVRTAAGLNSVILFFALALGVLVGIFVTRALLRPLGVLKRTALDVADRRLPEAMARIRDGELPGAAVEPVPVGTREEIGQVARAFDEVHSQAVRLASEQAQLRANVNDIFVNLSRRTQGLVERQLKLIDRLESSEQDPQQLDNLFQLDHLATRMRRNSENLLVLAGTEAANRSSRPVRLVDVLRAAVSEVEQYQRLVLQQPPAVLVLGRSASDLVHLLAELLDNATQFSPPDSHVVVASDFAADGSVGIEVADRGVGMTEAELAEANERLANPPVVDASVSRRMGLFVVGRLASRHDITVQLRRGEAGVGVWARVVVPSRLVRVASETVEPHAAALTPRVQNNGQEPGGHGAPLAAQQALTDQPGDASRLPRIAKRPMSATPPPTRPGPAEGSAADHRLVEISGTDLFRPTQAPVLGQTGVGQAEVGQAGTGHRATLQHSTPIFDDVASAWFKEHEAVPVRWIAPSSRAPMGVTREVPSPGGPLPDPPLPDAPLAQTPLAQTPPAQTPPAQTPPAQTLPTRTPSAEVPPRKTPVPAAPAVSAAASAPPLMRRQPGKTLAGSRSGDAGQCRLSGQPAPAPEATTPAPSPAQDWGAADEGWRAAQALAMPLSAELTPMGLPRRQPRALLVPGAVSEAESAASAPARNAELIRGRLASYQQGIREGRQATQNLDQETDGSSATQQDGRQET
jgi:signal transduction histidine kinase